MLVEKIIEEIFDEQYVYVVQGIGAQIIPLMTSSVRFDHIFFTGKYHGWTKNHGDGCQATDTRNIGAGGKEPHHCRCIRQH